MKPEIIEVKEQVIALYDLPQTEEGMARCDIVVSGLGGSYGKAKALIVILPQHSNEVPEVINVGLNHIEISKSIDILKTIQRHGEQYGGIRRELLHET